MERDVISAFTHIDKSLNFNSHAHVERDIISDFINWNNGISTHTLTWSVTIDKVGRMIFVDNFNSHAHVERDSSAIPDRNIHWISTHTLTWSVTSSVVTLQPSTIFQLTRSRGA